MERLAAVGGRLLEGPAWDDGRLLFVDIEGGELLTLGWGDRRLQRRAFVETPSAWLPRASGGTVVAARSGLRGEDGTLLVPLEAERPDLRTNDATCDPEGRLWLGTMDDDGREGEGSLLRIDPDGSVHRVLDGLAVPNGPAFGADGRGYFADTPTERIDVLGGGVLADVSHLDGAPDGMAVDVEGCLWVAFHGGSAVHRISPDGEVLTTLRVPEERVTSCAFAGPDLDVLVVTAANDLYAADPGVRGVPVARFAG